jgi:SNF2 family DNA or RNA helicase
MIILRDYQELAVQSALPHDGYGLFMQPRTGKTITALELSKRWVCKDNLIICPKKAIPVWAQEIERMELNAEHFEIFSFESFRIKHMSLIRDRDLVIIDESHRIKERGSQQTKACWKVGRRAKRRLILTGTPQGNGCEDYYSQLRFIRPDLFPTWGRFSDRYLIMGERFINGREDPFPTIEGYQNQGEFKQILKNISYRVTRDEVAKVKTIIRTKKYYITPGEAFQRPYIELEKDLMTEIQGNLITAPMALTKALKLHQVCGGFIKDDDKVTHAVHTDKLDFLWGLLDGELKGQSVCVVANYKAEMDAIAEGLKSRGITYVQIRGRHQYDPKDRSQVTLLNPSAGEAINLAHHDHMVIYSMNYSYLKWEQFKDRIVLVDTPVAKYYYLLMKGTMDEVVYSAVIEKKKLSDSIMSIYKTLGCR